MGGSSAEVYCILLQADGQIILGGWFTTFNGQARNNIVRLNNDGTLDLTFNPGPSSPLSSTASYCLALQADGKLLVGGLARLNNTKPATQTLSLDGVGITWLRGGASPEVWRTTFECSTNGTDWFFLGSGTRITGGWYLTGASVTTDATIRARGYVTGGNGNRSGWFVENSIPVGQPSPVIQVNDGFFGFHTNTFGFNMSAILGQHVVLEGSTDLLNWIAISTNTICSPSIYLCDPDAPNLSRRFYRARLQ
jgi:hypothetical protein